MDNSERIKKWKEERARVAAEERAARVEQAQAERKAHAEERMKAREAEASERRDSELGSIEATIPDADTIERAKLMLKERRVAHSKRMLRSTALYFALPVLLLSVYLYFMATPFFTANGTFAVQTVNNQGSSGMLGPISLGTGVAMSDEFRVREFILSREMMRKMEEKYAFLSHFSADDVDWISRFRGPFGINSDEYDYFLSKVSVSADIQQGLLRLSVRAKDAASAERFANGMMEFAEQQVNLLSIRVQTDQLAQLSADSKLAEKELADARKVLHSVQSVKKDVEPKETITAIYQRIAGFETQLAEAKADRDQLLANGLDKSPVLPRLQARVAVLEKQITEQRGRLAGELDGKSSGQSLNAFEDATLRKEMAQARWEASLQTLQQAKLQNLRERRYFLVVAHPVSNVAAQFSSFMKWSLGLMALLLLYLVGSLLMTVRRMRE